MDCLHCGYFPLFERSYFKDRIFYQKIRACWQSISIELASDCFRRRVDLPELHAQGSYYIRGGNSPYLRHNHTLQDDF
jgi:hypothetical protein